MPNTTNFTINEAAASTAILETSSGTPQGLIVDPAASGGATNGKTKHPGRTGRPIEYKPCLVKKLYDYFNGFVPDGTRVLPSFEGFAQKQRVSIQAMNEWSKRFSDFGEAMKNCLNIQKEWLVNGALSERYHPGFTKFLMINNHGMISDNAVQQANVNLAIPQGLNIRFIDSTRS